MPLFTSHLIFFHEAFALITKFTRTLACEWKLAAMEIRTGVDAIGSGEK